MSPGLVAFKVIVYSPGTIVSVVETVSVVVPLVIMEVSVTLAGAKFGAGLIVVELAAKLMVPVKRLRLLTVIVVLLVLPA